MFSKLVSLKKMSSLVVVAVMVVSGLQLSVMSNTAEASRLYVPPSNRCYERKRPLFFNHVIHEVRCFKDYPDRVNRWGRADYWYTFSSCVEKVSTSQHVSCNYNHLHVL